MTADIEEMALNSPEIAATRAEIAPDTRENGVRSVETTENTQFTRILAALGKERLSSSPSLTGTARPRWPARLGGLGKFSEANSARTIP